MLISDYDQLRAPEGGLGGKGFGRLNSGGALVLLWLVCIQSGCLGYVFLSGEDENETPADCFLAGHEPFAAKIRYDLARAYETWWSFSQALPGGTFIQQPADVRPGSEAAREKALQIYRGQLAAQPDNLWFKERIFRLEHHIDTVQRRYTCSIC